MVCHGQILPQSTSSQKSGAFQLIRNLEIQNFRCFRALTIKDARRFTIVTGPNAAGKTALLEAIFLAGGNGAETWLKTSIWRGRENFPLPTQPSSITPILEEYFYQYDVTQALRIWFRDSRGDEREIGVAARKDAILNLPFDTTKPLEAVSSQPPTLSFAYKTPKGEVITSPEMGADGVRMARPEDAYLMIFLNTSTIGGAKEVADRYSELSRENREGAIVKAVKDIFPYVTDLSVLSPGGASAIHATVRGVNRKIPLGQLSSGINKFVAILSAIITARGNAVLVDEIENGWYYAAHSEMWKKIVAVADAENTQLFASTHSNEFLQHIAPIVAAGEIDYRLIRLEKTNGTSEATEFSGREFSSAIASGVDVR